MNYNTCTLDNGLRVILLHADSPVVYCGYQIAAGTRHERSGEEGLAHFVEHMTFKGTHHRSSMQILNTLEHVGGDLNAFTVKEATVYYAAILKEHLPKAVDLLTDIVFHSTYPQQEINKEVEVICDEIESYNDSPSELIYDDFESILFKGHPLGHNILGEAERVRQFTTADALRFTQRYYRPENAVFYVYGDVKLERVVNMLCRKMDAQENTPVTPSPQPATILQPPTRMTVLHKQTHQAHVMVGNRAYPFKHPLRLPLFLLNNMLGGPGMNARLNIALRERNGLVYTVESTVVNYGDTGFWAVYFGCDPHDVKRCLRLVHRELDKFITKPLSEQQLRAAKRQLKGQIGIACDNHEQFALDFGRSFLYEHKGKNLEDLYTDIDRITAAEIQQAAREIMAEDRLCTLIYQ